MRFDDLDPQGLLAPAEAADVDAAERAFGGQFPLGYRGFITRFGRGLIGGLVRIYMPVEILAGPRSFAEWRRRIDEYWFWDAGAHLLTKARALECVCVGDTVGGDELVFHPAAPDRAYILPHDFDDVYFAGDGLEAAVAWFFTSGVLDEPFQDASFVPY